MSTQPSDTGGHGIDLWGVWFQEGDRMRGYARKRLHNAADVDDAMQTTVAMVTQWAAERTFLDKLAASNGIWRIHKNKVADILRGRYRDQRLPAIVRQPSPEPPADQQTI